MARARGFLLLLVLLGGCAGGPPDGAVLVDRGWLHAGAGEAAPAADAPGWRAVGLPDAWFASRRSTATEGWYRFELPLAAAPAVLWAVYLPRIGMNGAVYVNGALVGDGGPFAPRISRNWNRPLLFTVPADLLHAGTNVLHVRLATAPSSPGFLAPFLVGPHATVRPAWAWRTAQQITAAQVALALTLLTALVLGFLYVGRDPRGQYRWFVLGTLLWSPSALDTLVRDPGIPTRVWECTTQASLNWAVTCCIIALHRAVGVQRPRLERVMFAVAVAGTAALAVVPAVYQFQTMLLWLVWTIALGGYALIELWRVGHLPTFSRSRPFLLAALVGVAFGAHDVGALLLGAPLGGALLSAYIVPTSMIATGCGMLLDLSEKLRQAEALNLELEQRVADKHAELERNYERLGALEREQAVTAERDRIMRDMHDGMGGQLVSTLAMVESGRFSGVSVADAIQAALDDMRLVIDSLEPVEGDLLALLGMVRGRLEPRLARHGLCFDWQVADLPPLPGFGPERALQVLRIVQEAVTNVVKHAEASTIIVRTGAAPGPGGASGVFVEIADDGRGFAGERPGGRGLANMRRRAAAVGGAVSVGPGAPGTAVRLWLPAEGAGAARTGTAA